MTLTDWLAARRAELDHLFDARLATPADGDPGRLVEAMRYSLLAPGKRIRPLLALAAAETVGPVGDDVRSATGRSNPALPARSCWALVPGPR